MQAVQRKNTVHIQTGKWGAGLVDSTSGPLKRTAGSQTEKGTACRRDSGSGPSRRTVDSQTEKQGAGRADSTSGPWTAPAAMRSRRKCEMRGSISYPLRRRAQCREARRHREELLQHGASCRVLCGSMPAAAVGSGGMR